MVSSGYSDAGKETAHDGIDVNSCTVDMRKMSRFYEVGVQQTLFGDWAVVYRWGRIGTHGRVCQDWFESLPEARIAQADRVARKRRRGYTDGLPNLPPPVRVRVTARSSGRSLSPIR